jgi:hypothetical protein
MKVVLKELRESGVDIKIIEKSKLHLNTEAIAYLQNECNQLISIFVKSIGTAEPNSN